MITTTSSKADFATRLYDQLAKSPATKDLVFSPFSIEAALAMCAAGARGSTRNVLAELLGAPASVEEQNRAYADRLRAINEAGGRNVQLTAANALWLQQGFRVHPEYQKALADFYGGAANTVNFTAQAEQAVAAINAWVESKTQGKIKTLIQRDLITNDTRLVLTNAIYFKGKWSLPFDKSHTWDEDWHGPGGVRKVPLMQRTAGYDYFECAEYQAVDLSYEGDRLSMLIVLPRKADGLAALEKQWAAGNGFGRATSGLAHEESVVVALPRFKMECALSLKPALSALGAAAAFGDQADFSGISAEPLKISEVIHKAFIEVNEEGTEAAAATGVVMAKCARAPSEPKQFRADHPFLFVIRERQSNAALFAGRVLEPRE